MGIFNPNFGCFFIGHHLKMTSYSEEQMSKPGSKSFKRKLSINVRNWSSWSAVVVRYIYWQPNLFLSLLTYFIISFYCLVYYRRNPVENILRKGIKLPVNTYLLVCYIECCKVPIKNPIPSFLIGTSDPFKNPFKDSFICFLLQVSCWCLERSLIQINFYLIKVSY